MPIGNMLLDVFLMMMMMLSVMFDDSSTFPIEEEDVDDDKEEEEAVSRFNKRIKFVFFCFLFDLGVEDRCRRHNLTQVR